MRTVTGIGVSSRWSDVGPSCDLDHLTLIVAASQRRDYHAAVASRAWRLRGAAALPLVLLLAYATAFASAALGLSTIAFDDHPGQLYRLWHVVNLGPAPWAWNPGWWTGYPELQFYPPAVAYLGALAHAVTLGTVSLAAIYQMLVWLAYVLPGLTAWLLLARLLGD
jgi:hypothetical protein